MELTSKNLPSTLVFLGLLTKEEVAEIMMKHVEYIIYEVFNWTEGSFVFKDNELPDNEHVINALNTMSILMEGTRRIDEWNRIRNALPRENTIMKMVQSGLEQTDEVRLTAAEARVLSLTDGQRSIEEIKEKSPFDELETSRAIYGLMMSGLITTAGSKESKKVKIEEQKRLLQIILRVYGTSFDIIRDELTKKMGNVSDNIMLSAYQQALKSHPVLENMTATKEGGYDFVNFATLAERLPKEGRIYIISSGLAELLRIILEKTRSSLGNRQLKVILSIILSKVGEELTENKVLLRKYSVYEDFFRVLQINK